MAVTLVRLVVIDGDVAMILMGVCVYGVCRVQIPIDNGFLDTVR